MLPALIERAGRRFLISEDFMESGYAGASFVDCGRMRVLVVEDSARAVGFTVRDGEPRSSTR
jgi:hypothetical protein